MPARIFLVVDDSKVVRKVARRILEANGLRAEFADRPAAVFCTTATGIDRTARAVETGANEYIMKPSDEAILIDRFRQVGLL
jgi:CheY-like chemotaxis protein